MSDTVMVDQSMTYRITCGYQSELEGRLLYYATSHTIEFGMGFSRVWLRSWGMITVVDSLHIMEVIGLGNALALSVEGQ